jgi:transposase
MLDMRISTEGVRQRAILAYEAKEGTQAQIAKMYRVSLRTFQRWWRQYRQRGTCAPGQRGHRRAAYEGKDLRKLDRLVSKHSDSTLEELREATGKDCSIMAVHRALDRLKWRFKKSRYARVSETDPM